MRFSVSICGSKRLYIVQSVPLLLKSGSVRGPTPCLKSQCRDSLYRLCHFLWLCEAARKEVGDSRLAARLNRGARMHRLQQALGFESLFTPSHSHSPSGHCAEGVMSERDSLCTFLRAANAIWGRDSAWSHLNKPLPPALLLPEVVGLRLQVQRCFWQWARSSPFTWVIQQSRQLIVSRQ